VDGSILKEVIECAEKGNPNSVGAFRITENELSFYRRMNLPLPRVCFDIRHIRRMDKRPPLKIIKRNCSKCSLEVETIYDENYAPIIYCEKCYQKEVY
jgi:formylmethanofuran dehydrogenase subunit E